MITDQLKRGTLQIEYCPTDDMLVDYMTKGLQGVKFSRFRRRIMGMYPEPYNNVGELNEFGLMKQ